MNVWVSFASRTHRNSLAILAFSKVPTLKTSVNIASKGNIFWQGQKTLSAIQKAGPRFSLLASRRGRTFQNIKRSRSVVSKASHPGALRRCNRSRLRGRPVRVANIHRAKKHHVGRSFMRVVKKFHHSRMDDLKKNHKQLKSLRSELRREGQIVLRQEQRARMAWSGNG